MTPESTRLGPSGGRGCVPGPAPTTLFPAHPHPLPYPSPDLWRTGPAGRRHPRSPRTLTGPQWRRPRVTLDQSRLLLLLPGCRGSEPGPGPGLPGGRGAGAASPLQARAPARAPAAPQAPVPQTPEAVPVVPSAPGGPSPGLPTGPGHKMAPPPGQAPTARSPAAAAAAAAAAIAAQTGPPLPAMESCAGFAEDSLVSNLPVTTGWGCWGILWQSNEPTP